MGLWDVVRARSRPRRNDLDALFLVPSAAITLQTASGLQPTGVGAVCYRAASGAAFAETQAEIGSLVSAEGAPATTTTDEFGFTWLVLERDPTDLSQLCTELHAANTTLEAQGFADGLLCSTVTFTAPGERRVALVYLYKQGTFYPFAPLPDRQRDNLLELAVRDQLAGELPVEEDLPRWLAVWGAPGL